MLLSRLLDRGPETLTLYPEIPVVNNYGATVMVPDRDNPVKIPVSVSTGRQSDSEVPGQLSTKVLNLMCREFPAGSWAEADFRGEKWSVAEPTVETVGMSIATDHVEIVLRSENQVVA